jgi:cell wall assembly regulator SMI1
MRYASKLASLSVVGQGLSAEAIESASAELHLQFPDEYKEFLLEADGAEGLWGEKNYAIVWPIESLKQYNEAYEVSTYLPGAFLFGSDGGGEAFAFDLKNQMAIVRVPFVGMKRDLAIVIAKTFAEFIDVLSTKDIYELH